MCRKNGHHLSRFDQSQNIPESGYWLLIACVKHINKFAISSRTALKLPIRALRSYLKLTCEYELHISSNTKVNAAKDHGENYMKIRRPWSAIFIIIIYCYRSLSSRQIFFILILLLPIWLVLYHNIKLLCIFRISSVKIVSFLVI